MHHPLVSINPVEALSALLVDIDNSRYALDKHSGPGAAIWRAASGLTPFGMRALAQLIEAAPELLAEGRKYLG
jgi:hypothetical protein